MYGLDNETTLALFASSSGASFVSQNWSSRLHFNDACVQFAEEFDELRVLAHYALERRERVGFLRLFAVSFGMRNPGIF
jgi:hypothetical protein